ncbi:argininosuccinate lyase [Eubacteriales bacterium OttesenSCG-928-A19]|nr:argininosuccinate lyase [Eubacteriales bacterium OttesenSCG-928-A19]
MKLWGGRFSGDTAALVDAFNASIAFDQRLYRQDIEGSIAHARMLGKQRILTPEDTEAIVSGLHGILADAEAGRIQWREDAEDIHMNVELLLTERIGEAGKRLHTGRSRNDQVALDFRMYVREACDETRAAIESLLEALLETAERHLDTLMPGYTHLQRAQPITLAHHLMAYAQMLLRDRERFSQARARANVMPLGAGALAGTTYPIDRAYVAELLGFATITANSLDAVSDRDFALDFLHAASVCMMHLSRFSEELILWSSQEFAFVTMDDAYSTGSSIMPQKKNPDVAELVRGKTGRVFADLQSLLVTLKGLPLAYNKDMQEDKEALFDAYDTLSICLPVFTEMFRTLSFDTQRMARAAAEGFTNATDAADYLVRKGLPFRDAHEVLGRLVAHCIQENKALLDLSLEELRAFSPVFDDDVFGLITPEACVDRRNLPGGPAPDAVRAAIEAVRREMTA